ncbi:hypothetical protein P280DRAFT_553820 [Massarina eburnea CBS 473.64]|uniref:NTF2-like protein n=1 Tax=Massarina eburnea CBS 473.64 TaxID=1395130 RepID=A0A6A6RJF9_9PLEO|nr:hypothetical protein P280DRAFT_553820 [Massarina eburnea CBS 473.64]
MSLSAYKAFLAAPSPTALADSASLHYVTTLTSLNDAAAIMKHFTVLERILKTKEQKVIGVVDGGDALALDVETTIEFVNGGGAYLPGMDDNFLADRIATFPVLHIVHFDSEGKIAQIRLQWDQGSLLKQVEVMGARARNWPVRDGKDQLRLIATSSAKYTQDKPANGSAGRGADEVSIVERSSRKPNKNAMNDPYASLDLFQPRDVNQDVSPSRQPAPRTQSAKPPPRDLNELFVGEESGPAPAVTESPSKHGIPVKAGGGKNYKGNRLFGDEEEEAAPTAMSTRKTNSKKYEHFEFGDGEDTPKVRAARPANAKPQHQANWDFEDFVTPEKTKSKVLSQNVRHFGWSDDEEEASPVRRPVVHKERPNLQANFEFEDDGTPDGQRKPAPLKGGLGNKGMGLYTDHVLGDNEEDDADVAKGDNKRAINDVTTRIKGDHRNKDFGSSWEMNDASPAHDKTTFKQAAPQIKKKATTTNWSHYENKPEGRGINIAGNGMGARKGQQFSLYEDEPEIVKKENQSIKSMGNGMGGRKGTGFDWDF